MNFIQKKNLEKFKTSIMEYFNYVWSIDMGLNQKELLSQLPSALVTDIRLTRDNYILNKTELFTDGEEALNMKLCRSMF
jgi:hypothetical protein